MILQILYALSSGVLGVFLGAQVCEGVLLIPYWKTLSPKDFFELHKTYGEKIYKFFAPLTIIATLVPISTAIYSLVTSPTYYVFPGLMALVTLLFFSTYFLYFKQANQRFAETSIAQEDLPKELNKWEKWHWGRIYLELIALIAALITLAQA